MPSTAFQQSWTSLLKAQLNFAMNGVVAACANEDTLFARRRSTTPPIKANIMKFYYHPSPNPAKVALFLEESGLDYQMVPVDTARGEQHGAAYRAINCFSSPAVAKPSGTRPMRAWKARTASRVRAPKRPSGSPTSKPCRSSSCCICRRSARVSTRS